MLKNDGEKVNVIYIFVRFYKNFTLKMVGIPAETCWWEYCE
jgi:hypothetical protein